VDASDRWIVVGFDGSEGADRALDWALAEANLRGARVLVVHAYEKCLGGVDPIVAELVARDAQAVLDRALSRAREEEVDAEGILMDESPTKALTEASEGAELLVVGSRGLGGLTGALLGSVSTACVRHATCPILVVPSPARAERARTGEAAGNADQLDGSASGWSPWERRVAPGEEVPAQPRPSEQEQHPPGTPPNQPPDEPAERERVTHPGHALVDDSARRDRGVAGQGQGALANPRAS